MLSAKPNQSGPKVGGPLLPLKCIPFTEHRSGSHHQPVLSLCEGPGPRNCSFSFPYLCAGRFGRKRRFPGFCILPEDRAGKTKWVRACLLIEREKWPVSQETAAELPRGQMTIVRMPPYSLLPLQKTILWGPNLPCLVSVQR